MFDLVIRGGTIVKPDGLARADLAIGGGAIKAVAAPEDDVKGANVIDAAGKLILPGLVDAHVHIPGYWLGRRLDDFSTATAAAAIGGVTTIMLMPTDDPRTVSPSYFERKKRIGEDQSFVDFAIQVLVSPKTECQDIENMAKLGAVSFELFLAYGGNPAFVVGNDDYELQRLMREVRAVGGVVGVTPHSGSLIAKLTELQKEREANRRYRDPEDRREDPPPPVQIFAVTRPTLSEGLGITRACTVACETGTRIHLRSLSSQKSIDLMRRFRNSMPLSSEVMSHHLTFTQEEAEQLGPYGVIIPPIRTKEEREHLRDAIRKAEIDMVVSDHSPVLREDKEVGWSDVWRTPPGMPGLQTLCASMLALVDEGELSMPDIARSCAEAPAKHFGLHPRKGALQVGSDADFIIINGAETMLVTDSQQRSKADYTTLKGRRINSRIESVYLRGNLIARNGETVARSAGRFVHP
jgi:dihydroorotase